MLPLRTTGGPRAFVSARERFVRFRRFLLPAEICPSPTPPHRRSALVPSRHSRGLETARIVEQRGNFPANLCPERNS